MRDSSLEKGMEQQVNIVASASGSEDRMAISVGVDGDEVAGGGGRKEASPGHRTLSYLIASHLFYRSFDDLSG